MDPILQMIIETDAMGVFGLKFTTETEDYLPPVFTIPLTSQHSLLKSEYYMPGEIAGEQVNFIATLQPNSNYLTINDERLGKQVRFLIAGEYPSGLFKRLEFDFPFIPFSPFLNPMLRYIGAEKSLVKSYEFFLLLVPIDLLIMDSLYLDENIKACFVGLTPEFGDREYNPLR